MRFAITVALLDEDHVVRHVVRVPPWRLVLPRPRARHVLECREDADVRVGDRLRFGPPSAAQGSERQSEEQAAEDGQDGDREREEGDDVATPRGDGERRATIGVGGDQPQELEHRAHEEGLGTPGPPA